MITKTKHIIGIDPDTYKSGVCYLNLETGKLKLFTATFTELMEYLSKIENTPEVVVVIEGGWLNHGNWHLNKNDYPTIAAKKGYGVGQNHETGRKIAEMSEKYYKLNTLIQKPLRKCWKGKDGKITHEELSYIVGNIGKQSNQETRDACLISWNYASLPIRVTPVKNG